MIFTVPLNVTRLVFPPVEVEPIVGAMMREFVSEFTPKKHKNDEGSYKVLRSVNL
jgi:hypothetical protein